jgi:hypothetical protein
MLRSKLRDYSTTTFVFTPKNLKEEEKKMISKLMMILTNF